MGTAVLPTSNILLRYSYPKVPGDQPWSMIDVRGPSTYTPFVPTAPGPPIVPQSGGQLIHAQDFGLQALDFVVAMACGDGPYTILVFPEKFALQSEFPAVRLAWMNFPTGQASGNLNQFIIRLLAIGR